MHHVFAAWHVGDNVPDLSTEVPSDVLAALAPDEISYPTWRMCKVKVSELLRHLPQNGRNLEQEVRSGSDLGGYSAARNEVARLGGLVKAALVYHPVMIELTVDGRCNVLTNAPYLALAAFEYSMGTLFVIVGVHEKLTLPVLNFTAMQDAVAASVAGIKNKRLRGALEVALAPDEIVSNGYSLLLLRAAILARLTQDKATSLTFMQSLDQIFVDLADVRRSIKRQLDEDSDRESIPEEIAA